MLYSDLYASICRSLWLFISHCLQAQESSFTAHNKSAKDSNIDFLSSLVCDRLDLILALVREIYACISATREGRLLALPCEYVPLPPSSEEADDCDDEQKGGGGSDNGVRGSTAVSTTGIGSEEYFDDDDEGRHVPLYDGVCLVVLTRMLHRKKLRPHAIRVLQSLPTVPLVCVHLLELLVLTGTKTGGAVTTQYGIKKRGAAAERGMRMIALDILSSLLLHESSMHDPHLFRACLFPILWLAVNEDFTLRTAAVNALVRYVCEIRCCLYARSLFLF